MRKYLFGLFIISLFFTSCRKDEISPLKITFEGFIFDDKTDEPILGATVEIRLKNEIKSATTDESGFYSLRNIPAGNYYLSIKKDGYLEEVEEVGNYPSSNSTTEEIIMNSNYSLSPLSEELTLTLLIRKASTNNTTAAPNVSFKYRFSEDGDTLMEGTTNSNGLIHLTNVPYKGIVYFIFDFNLDGSQYYSERYIYIVDLYESITVYEYIPNGILNIVSSNILSPGGGYVDDFSLSESEITIKFTQPIDIPSSVVTPSFGADTAWSESNTLLTLEIGSSLSPDTEYSINLQVKNADKEDNYYKTIYFKTEPLLMPI